MELENNDGSGGLHTKMCRKIAQLVKVIHSLNVKNSDQTKLISHLRDTQNDLLSEKTSELAKIGEELKREKDNGGQLLKKIKTADALFKLKLHQCRQEHSKTTVGYEKELNLMKSSLAKIKQNFKEKNDELENLRFDALQNTSSVENIKLTFEAELEKMKTTHNNEMKCLKAVYDENLKSIKDRHSESEKHVEELLEKVVYLEKQLVDIKCEYEANSKESKLKYEKLADEEQDRYQRNNNEKMSSLVQLQTKFNESESRFKRENEALSSELTKYINELKNSENQLLKKDSIIKSLEEKVAQQENTIATQEKQLSKDGGSRFSASELNFNYLWDTIDFFVGNSTNLSDRFLLKIEDLETFSHAIDSDTQENPSTKTDQTSPQHTEEIEKLLLESRRIIREILARASSLKIKTSESKQK